MSEVDLSLWADARLVSPWALITWVALKEKGVPFKLETVDLLRGDHKTGAYAEQSWTAKVPSLRHGERWMSESLAILEYVEEVFTPPRFTRLYPEDAGARARDRQILSFIRSDLFELRRCMPFPSILIKFDAPEMTDKARAEAARLVQIASTRYGSGPVRAPTVADFELAIALRRLMHFGELSDSAAIDYCNALWSRPSFQSWVALDRSHVR